MTRPGGSQLTTHTPKTVLFLCTGNYYRSRFAEALFNSLARKRGLPWRAESRGLAPEYGVNNVGPLSADTRQRLGALGIPVEGYLRMPLRVHEDDLRRADLVIAVKEAEHRPLLRERHPGWAERVEYWCVHDTDFAGPHEALPELEREVHALVARLAASDQRPSGERRARR